MFEISAVLTAILRTVLAVFGVRWQAYDVVDMARDLKKTEAVDLPVESMAPLCSPADWTKVYPSMEFAIFSNSRDCVGNVYCSED